MTNQYGLFFTRDETVLRLPMNPEKLPVEKDGDNEEYNVLGIGPITIPAMGTSPSAQPRTAAARFPTWLRQIQNGHIPSTLQLKAGAGWDGPKRIP